MGIANTSLIYNLGLIGTPIIDNVAVLSTTVPTPVAGELIRVVTSIASGLLVLKSILTGEAAALTFVVNDSPNSIIVKPFTGELQNGVANQGLTIPAANSGIFIRVPDNVLAGGDWRSNVIA